MLEIISLSVEDILVPKVSRRISRTTPTCPSKQSTDALRFMTGASTHEDWQKAHNNKHIYLQLKAKKLFKF